MNNPMECPYLDTGNFNCCVDCKCVCNFGSSWNGCFNCIHRDPLNGLGGSEYCVTCIDIRMLRPGAGVFTPSKWIWDDGNKDIDAVKNLVHQMHAAQASKKHLYLAPLQKALAKMEKMYPELFTKGEDETK